eukprot:3033897-Amphidinium_carterae.3
MAGNMVKKRPASMKRPVSIVNFAIESKRAKHLNLDVPQTDPVEGRIKCCLQSQGVSLQRTSQGHSCVWQLPRRGT